MRFKRREIYIFIQVDPQEKTLAPEKCWLADGSSGLCGCSHHITGIRRKLESLGIRDKRGLVLFICTCMILPYQILGVLLAYYLSSNMHS